MLHPPICLPPFCSPSLFVWTVLFSLQMKETTKTLSAPSSSCRSLWISFTQTAVRLTWNSQTSSFVTLLLLFSPSSIQLTLFLLHLPESRSCFLWQSSETPEESHYTKHSVKSLSSPEKKIKTSVHLYTIILRCRDAPCVQYPVIQGLTSYINTFLRTTFPKKW